MKKIALLFFILCPVALLGQTYLSQPSEAIELLNKVFDSKKDNGIKDICTKNFVYSDFFKKLNSFIGIYTLNFSKTLDEVEQEFNTINTNEQLVITFSRDKEKKWHAADASLKINDKLMPIAKKGLDPLSHLDYFVDLTNIVNEENSDFFSLDPDGKLSLKSLKKMALKTTSHSIYIYKNVFLTKKDSIVDMLYIKVKTVPYDAKSKYFGWVVCGGGYMSDFYKNNEYFQFLTKKTSKVDTNRPIPDLPSTINIDKIAKNDFSDYFIKEKKYFEITVKQGESLSSISVKYNEPIDKIKSINSLINDDIYVGQKLKIPK